MKGELWQEFAGWGNCGRSLQDGGTVEGVCNWQ